MPNEEVWGNIYLEKYEKSYDKKIYWFRLSRLALTYVISPDIN